MNAELERGLVMEIRPLKVGEVLRIRAVEAYMKHRIAV